MSNAIGEFVTDGSGGKPDASGTANTDRGVKQVVDRGQILNGYDIEGPDTAPIGAGSATIGTTGSARLTKRGTVDRRTIRGRAGAESTEQTQVHLSKISVEDVLYSLHLMGAEIFSTPELELDTVEAKKLGDAIQNVAKYYNIGFDPKKVAIFNLVTVAGMIYGTRFVAVRNRIKAAKATISPAPKATPITQGKPAQATAQSINLRESSPSAIFGDMSGAL